MDRVARRGRIPGRRFVVLDVGAALMSEGRALGDESVDSLRPQDFELMDGIAPPPSRVVRRASRAPLPLLRLRPTSRSCRLKAPGSAPIAAYAAPMDLPPPSDPQLVNLLAQQKKRRTQLVLLFAAIGITLAAAIGVSSVVFGRQGRKKGDLAYSRATKCLVGKPLASGEDPMLRYRAAWRGRILQPDTEGAGGGAGANGGRPAHKPSRKGSALGAVEASEEAKVKLWPNRCVAELIALTDTLKDIGEMTEGKKDLGAASRALAKATAGDNWKNVESYQPVLTDFLDEGRKAKFAFVDVPDVAPPVLVEAKTLDDLNDPKAIADTFELPNVFVPGDLLAFVPASSRGPARLCRGAEVGPITCTPASASPLPPEASGVPTVLDHDDGAPPLLAFGRARRFLEGEGMSTGVFRGGDGFRLVFSNTFYVGAGWSSKDGPATLLLKDGRKPTGVAFKVMALEGDKLRTDDAELTDWNGDARSLAVLKSRVYWITTDGEVRTRGEGTPKKGQALFKLPGAVDWMHACTIGASRVLVIRAIAAGALPRTIVSFDDQTDPAVVDGGDVSCGGAAVHVVSDDTIAVCKATGCQPEKITDTLGVARARVGDSAFLVGDLTDGVLVVRVFQGDKQLAETVYDSHVVGGKVTDKSAVGGIRAVPTRHGAVIAVSTSAGASFLGVTEAGAITRLSIEP